MNSSSSICVGPCNRKGSEVEKDCHPHTQFRHACQDSSAFVLSLHDGRIDTLKLNPSAVGRPEIRAAIHKSLSFTFLSLSLSFIPSLFPSRFFVPIFSFSGKGAVDLGTAAALHYFLTRHFGELRQIVSDRVNAASNERKRTSQLVLGRFRILGIKN